jgi:alpha-L-rhamnosidase
MLFAPFAGEKVCRRIPAPVVPKGTPNMEPRHALDGAAWLWHPNLKAGEAGLGLFRLNFQVQRNETITLQLSADMRFTLALDGALIARGPDTGDVHCWSFSAYEIKLKPGAHRLEVLVWWDRPPVAPAGRMSWRAGFACAGLGRGGDRFTTGKAAWRAAQLDGMKWSGPLQGFYHVIGGGARMELAKLAASAKRWSKPAVVRPPIWTHDCGHAMDGWKLEPSNLPEQRHDWWRGGRVLAMRPRFTTAEKIQFEQGVGAGEAGGWNQLLKQGKALRLPAGYRATLLIDTDDYLCGYPLLEVSGGKDAQVRWQWAEALYETENTTGPKGARNEIAGKWFYGFGDEWKLDGKRRWLSTPWWRSGRFWRIDIKVGQTPLMLRAMAVERTGYPLKLQGKFTADDATLAPVQRMAVRGLQACMHEVYVDCPYYEQLMYVADTRVQMLINHVVSGDDRLARRGMELFDQSRGVGGFPRMHYPGSDHQVSTTFAMIWPWMLHDYALWRDDSAWLKKRLPGLRALMESLEAETDADGLLAHPPGWLFVDWVQAWPAGWAPGSRQGRRSALVNLHYLLTLQKAADLETWIGHDALAQRWTEQAAHVARSLKKLFWSKARGLWADEESHTSFSQHAQALAVIAGLRAPALKKWFGPTAPAELHRATIYFQHYVFDALGQIGRADLILPALDTWRDLVKLDLKTPLENPQIGRSDCHAWGSHPLFHLRATVAGITPAAPCFKQVRIAPQPGTLTKIETKLPHPRGLVKLTAEFAGTKVTAEIDLPPETTGVFVWRGKEVALRAGEQLVQV